MADLLSTLIDRKIIFWLGGLVLLVGCGGDDGAPGDRPPGSSSSSSSSSASSSASSTGSSSSSGMASSCQEAAPGSGYCLVWSDEFQGSQLNAQKWSHEINCYGGGNNEAQCYMRDPDNLWVDGEYLHIRAIREDVQGPAVSDDAEGYDSEDVSGTGTFSSARIRSIGKGDWRYGRFEIRARLPAGQGTWPAVWMLPTDWVYGGWASSGEIDIVEAVNLKVGGEDRVHGTLHYGGQWPDNVYTGEEYRLPGGANPADDFHVYALEWEEGAIRWYVDGVHYATQTADGWWSAAASDDANAPFNQRFHLILNLAVGGDWAANVNDTGIDESAFPQELVVDYVRVYECSRDRLTGRGCATRDGAVIPNPGSQPPAPVDSGDGADFVVFDGGITAPYGWYTYTENGDIGFSVTAAGGDYGQAGEIRFNTDDGIGFFQTDAVVDVSGFAAVEFDVQVVADPRPEPGGLVFRADCVYPCTSGDLVIDHPGVGAWAHYRIELADLANSGLDLTAVNTPFVISPQGANDRGVVLQVDNVRLVR